MAYTEDLCTGGTAFWSSAQDGSHTGVNAFDNNESTYWQKATADMPSPYIGYQLSSAAKVVKLRVKFYSPYGWNAFKLQGSNDGSSYTDVLSTNAAKNSNWQEWTFENDTAYTYYRLLRGSDYTASYCLIYEIEMMAEESSGSAFIPKIMFL